MKVPADLVSGEGFLPGLLVNATPFVLSGLSSGLSGISSSFFKDTV